MEALGGSVAWCEQCFPRRIFAGYGDTYRLMSAFGRQRQKDIMNLRLPQCIQKVLGHPGLHSETFVFCFSGIFFGFVLFC